jgi:hypothetical protein
VAAQAVVDTQETLSSSLNPPAVDWIAQVVPFHASISVS